MSAKRQFISLIILSLFFILLIGSLSNFQFKEIGFFDFGYPNKEGPMYYNFSLKYILLGYSAFAIIWTYFIIRRYKKEKHES